MKFDYPETKKADVVENIHGVELNDAYRWMEDNKDPEVLAWDKAQNEFTDKYISKIPFRNKIRDRLLEFMKIDEMSIPQKVLNGDRIFQYKKNADDEKWVLFTQKNAESQLEELLNPNKWPQDETLHYYHSSRDGKYLVYGVSKGGNEDPVLKVMEIESRKVLSDSVCGWMQYISDWMPDGSGFYYSCKPLKGEVPEGEEFYWPAVYYHKLGTDKSEDLKLYFDDKVKENWYSVEITEDGRYIMLHKGQFYKNSIFFKGIDEKEFYTLAGGFDSEYKAEFFGEKIFIRTNKNAPNGKLYLADAVSGFDQNDWKEIIQEKDYYLEDFKIINGLLYLTYLKNACSLIQIYDLDGNYLKDVCLPDVGSAGIWGRQKNSDVWLWFSSFTLPSGIFKYDAEAGRATQYFMPNLNFRFFDYETEQVWYQSKDGTKVSMFIIKKIGSKPDKNTPCYMYAYGGFNISITPAFASSYAVWLESGGIVAVPNLRGGGEYGEEWHRAGMFEKKQNVFDDYIAAAEWLIARCYTCSEKLVMTGGSNGGLLIGAMITQRPDLMKAVYCGVPLLDMIRYHKSMLANIWKEEYGSAEEPEQFRYILKYSPYQNVKPGTAYPAAIITAGINDARVDPYHARKFTAALRDANASDQPILIQIQQSSGHGGGTQLSILAGQSADKMSFLMDQVGMEFIFKGIK
jgi:prolyl oligopeptidase